MTQSKVPTILKDTYSAVVCIHEHQLPQSREQSNNFAEFAIQMSMIVTILIFTQKYFQYFFASLFNAGI